MFPLENQEGSDGVDIPTLLSLRKIKSELTVTANGDVVLQAYIVFPHSLVHRAISLVHEGHKGVVKMKKLIREKVWFPGIDKEVEAR